jgi:hypothetical protein
LNRYNAICIHPNAFTYGSGIDIQDELPALTCRVNPRAVRSGFIVTNLIFAESRSLLFGQPLANTVAEAPAE